MHELVEGACRRISNIRVKVEDYGDDREQNADPYAPAGVRNGDLLEIKRVLRDAHENYLKGMAAVLRQVLEMEELREKLAIIAVSIEAPTQVAVVMLEYCEEISAFAGYVPHTITPPGGASTK